MRGTDALRFGGERRVERARTPAGRDMNDDRGALAAASVLAEALGIDEEPAAVAEAMERVAADDLATTWAIELDANGNAVAFLLYAYDLDRGGEAARTRMAADLAVMVEAAERRAPGPRPVAQAEAGGWGVVVATTPAVLAGLVGEGSAAAAAPDDASNNDASAAEPGEAAAALLGTLRDIERRADAYLRAVDAAGEPGPEERELALFLTDGRSLARLTAAVRRAIERSSAGS